MCSVNYIFVLLYRDAIPTTRDSLIARRILVSAGYGFAAAGTLGAHQLTPLSRALALAGAPDEAANLTALMVRKSYLDGVRRCGSRQPELWGKEPFVQVSLEVALGLTTKGINDTSELPGIVTDAKVGFDEKFYGLDRTVALREKAVASLTPGEKIFYQRCTVCHGPRDPAQFNEK